MKALGARGIGHCVDMIHKLFCVCGAKWHPLSDEKLMRHYHRYLKTFPTEFTRYSAHVLE